MKLAYLTILILTTPAFAGDKIEIPEQPVTRSVANAGASSNAVSTSNSQSSSNSLANSTSSSNSGGNTFSSDDDTYLPRQVPPVFLPMILTSGCGAGINAGGSGDGGAGAAGLTWTTKRCYALRSALNFFAIGEYETGCELLIDVNREAFKRVKKPNCADIARRLNQEAQGRRESQPLTDQRVLPQSASTAPPVSVEREAQCASKEYVGQVVDRAVRACVSK